MATSAMQDKLDKMLARGIEDVKALGIDLYDIEPHVRITRNRTRLGSAQDKNRALVKVPHSYKTRVVEGRKPHFLISITEREFDTDAAIMNILYHEILHCAPDCQNHQKIWKAYAERVNRAYNANVTVTKKAESSATENIPGREDIAHLVGKRLKDKNHTYIFTGFNTRPKNCCDIQDASTGKRYVCVPAYIAKLAEAAPPKRKATTHRSKNASDAQDVLKLVGRKVKNGIRGRKVFTVVAVDLHDGKRAVVLEDENGVEYTGSLECAKRLIVIG